MKVKVQKITPAIAKKMLEKNTNNRRIRDHHVWKLSQAMERGTFMENGDPIRMNGDQLLDGQHRLNAIVRSGKSYHFVVVSGLPSEVFSTVDRGVKRSTQDSFDHLGEKYAALAAGFCSSLLDYMFQGRLTSRRWSTIVSDFEKLEFLDKYQTCREAIQFAGSLAHATRRLINPSTLATLGFLSSFTRKIAWKDYWRAIVTGDDIQYQGARLYRRLLINNLQSSNRKMSREMLMGYGVLAFNKDAGGTEVKSLTITKNYPRMVNVPHDAIRSHFRLPDSIED